VAGFHIAHIIRVGTRDSAQTSRPMAGDNGVDAKDAKKNKDVQRKGRKGTQWKSKTDSNLHLSHATFVTT